MNCTALNRKQGKIEPNTTTKLEKALLPCTSAYGGDIAKMLRSIPLENAGAVYQLYICAHWIVISLLD